LLQIIASKGRFVFGVRRRPMKTTGYLSQIDKLVGAPVTAQNGNTTVAIVRIPNAEEQISPKSNFRAARIKIALARGLG